MKRILLVDDHELLREGVKRIFDKQSEAITFGEASTGLEALKLARQEEWDIVVLDLSLGSRSGLEVLKELKQFRPRLPVLDSQHAHGGPVRASRFQSRSFRLHNQDSPRSELLKAINKVIGAGTYVTPMLFEQLVVDLGRATDHPPHEALSIASSKLCA